MDAAAATADGNASCTGIAPFYWEIGDASGKLAGGTEPATATTPDANTVMQLYSASKWLFSTFAVQKLGGSASLATDVVQALTMTSAYNQMSNDSCLGSDTVASCDARQNSVPIPGDLGVFAYNSGHMEHLGATNTDLGIAADDDAALKSAIDAELGGALSDVWSMPELAGGAFDSAADYATLLRRIIDPAAPLLMNAALGTHAVCTHCDAALSSTLGQPQSQEYWHYSLGHWVEDDPTVGDGAFSSPGAAGFYPWIDATRTWYGVLARQVSGGSTGSVLCGRLIRKGWLTGTAQ